MEKRSVKLQEAQMLRRSLIVIVFEMRYKRNSENRCGPTYSSYINGGGFRGAASYIPSLRRSAAKFCYQSVIC